MDCQTTRKDAEANSVLAVGTHKEGTLGSYLLSSYYEPTIASVESVHSFVYRNSTSRGSFSPSLKLIPIIYNQPVHSTISSQS